MKPEWEHSAEPPEGSNRDSPVAWRRLARACRLVASDAPDPGELLALAVDALGAERAFLVRADAATPGTFSILAYSSKRTDGAARPSRSIVLRALAAPRAIVRTDLDPVAGDVEASVRGLDLRTVASVPLIAAGSPAALVLDSRRPPPMRSSHIADLLGAFAALLAVIDRGPSHPEGRAPSGPASPAGTTMHDWARRVARTELPVLVRGESGSGKEGISRSVHAWSRRADGPFVPVNCTALTESLVEAELFGAVRGAYTGADRDRPGLFRLADGGTLFLDEIGDMPPAMQAKLLRALEERRIRPVGGADEIAVDVRIVAATHRDLAAEVSAGRFRADLYHRLAVLEVEVPPLRERFEDLPPIVEALAPRLERETGHGPLVLAPDAWPALRSHDWPGNVRELHSVLARALLRSGGHAITAADLDVPRPSRDAPEAAPAGRNLERAMIESALGSVDGSVSHAATRIGWSRQKLYRRMRALGIDPRDGG